MKQQNKIIQELDRIASTHGGILQPETIVEEARRPSSPLHSKFTWEDTAAAHLWRLEEARKLIRVTVKMFPNSETNERIWVSLRHDREQEGGGYRTLVSVLSNKELRKQLLAEAFRDMEYFQEKYSHLEELAKVISEIKKIKK